jgi:hypothetical protein
MNGLPEHNKAEDQRKALKILTLHQKNHPELHWLDDRQQELFGFEGETLVITSVLISNKTDLQSKLLLILGKAQYIDKQAQDIAYFKGKVLKFLILSDQEINQDWADTLNRYHIEVLKSRLVVPLIDNV